MVLCARTVIDDEGLKSLTERFLVKNMRTYMRKPWPSSWGGTVFPRMVSGIGVDGSEMSATAIVTEHLPENTLPQDTIHQLATCAASKHIPVFVVVTADVKTVDGHLCMEAVGCTVDFRVVRIRKCLDGTPDMWTDFVESDGPKGCPATVHVEFFSKFTELAVKSMFEGFGGDDGHSG